MSSCKAKVPQLLDQEVMRIILITEEESKLQLHKLLKVCGVFDPTFPKQLVEFQSMDGRVLALVRVRLLAQPAWVLGRQSREPSALGQGALDWSYSVISLGPRKDGWKPK